MIHFLRKVSHRLRDPVFYRKRRTLRQAKQNPRHPRQISLAELPHGPVLVAIAHPDDEIFCSGLLCELAQTRPITVFCTTRGEGGHTGNFVTRSDLSKTREIELIESCKALGISDVRFGDYVDPYGTEFRTFPPAIPEGELEQRLRQLAGEIDARLIISHGSGGEYWHPAHLQLHDAAILTRIPLLTFNAWNPNHRIPRLLNRADPADLVFDASVHRQRRLKALEAHCTQSGYFKEVAGSINRFIDQSVIESYCNRLNEP